MCARTRVVCSLGKDELSTRQSNIGWMSDCVSFPILPVKFGNALLSFSLIQFYLIDSASSFPSIVSSFKYNSHAECCCTCVCVCVWVWVWVWRSLRFRWNYLFSLALTIFLSKFCRVLRSSVINYSVTNAVGFNHLISSLDIRTGKPQFCVSVSDVHKRWISAEKRGQVRLSFNYFVSTKTKHPNYWTVFKNWKLKNWGFLWCGNIRWKLNIIVFRSTINFSLRNWTFSQNGAMFRICCRHGIF